jgi:predicted metalloprotease
MGRRSDNVEDRRGFRVSPIGLAGGGLGTILLVVAALFLGVDPSVILDTGGQDVAPPAQRAPVTSSPAEDRLVDFVRVVLADTEDTWHGIFQQAGGSYQEPRLVLFSGAVQSACGMGQSAMGPFYCPGDQKVYLDLSFFREMQERLGAPGDFAQAYVIAHEIGHHVQNLLGVSEKVEARRRQVGEREANRLSVRLELQADCYAGIWGHHADRTRQLLEQGDIEEGLNAAQAIGDDRLQKRAQGYVVPDSFTHGSSAQRMEWFRRGLQSGDPRQCNTFATATR